MPALSRRAFLAAFTAAGGAAAAVPAAAAPSSAQPPVRPGPAKPVRALYGEQPYWDFTGAPAAQSRKAKPQAPLEDLPAEQRWLMGVY